MKTKAQSEPQKLEKSLNPPKGYKNTLDEEQAKRMSRKQALHDYWNKVVKDTF